MKNRIVILILVGLLAISFAGCNNKAQNKTTADQETGTKDVESVASGTEESDDTTSAFEELVTQNKAENVQQDRMDDTAEKKETQITESADGIKKEAETQKNVKTEKPAKVEEPKETETQEETVPAEVKTPTQMLTPTPTETPKAEETPSGEPSATTADTKAVADKVLEYINSYRSSPATKLTGLTGYAEYRSRQLIGNFAHDTADERTAATALKYGSYIDPALYGIEGTPYYTVNAREAIAKAGYTGTVDEVAESLAKLVKNSQSHWKYVCDSAYQYIGVGITYESGMWYCDIAVATENTDNN